MRNIALIVTALLASSVYAGQEWTADQRKVIAFLELAPKTYATGTYDEYMKLYDPGFTNWYMSGTEVHAYEKIKEVIGKNFGKTVKIVDYRVTPITIEIDGDQALVRYVEESLVERGDGKQSWATYHFFAVLKKNAGGWRFYRTNIVEVPDEPKNS